MTRAKKIPIKKEHESDFTVQEFAETLSDFFDFPVSANIVYSYIRKGWIKSFVDEKTRCIMIPDEELVGIIKRGHVNPKKYG
jgi:hypothetical protein